MTRKNWIILILIGLTGQLAWMLENMYLNVFLFNELKGTPADIAWMVSLSAIVATLTTIFMGSLSDKLGNRKKFIVYGYLVWGISVLAFSGFKIVSHSIMLFIFWDCLMTFLGSTANDAAFNAWVTDNTKVIERGKVESVLAILPLIAMLIIFGALDPLTQQGQWPLFFGLIGALVFMSGIVANYHLVDHDIKQEACSLKETISMGFKPETVKQHQPLYLSFVLLMLISIATQIWMPYLIIYIQKTLLIQNYALILGVVLTLSAIVGVVVGRLITPSNNYRWLIIGLIIEVIGLSMMAFVKQQTLVMIFGTVLMSGNMILITISSGLVRDNTPQNTAGRFQGVRMIFNVMLPMIIGPWLGSLVIASSNQTYTELGIVKLVPTSHIFLISIVVLIFILIPIYFLQKGEKAHVE